MRLVRELVGYGLASAAALMLDMALLWLLVDVFSWHYLAAATLSFLAGAVLAYYLSLQLAFHYHRLRDRRVEFASFVLLGTIGLGVNALVLSLAVGRLHLDILPAKACAACCTFGCNFVVRRQLLFARRVTG